MLPSRWWRKGYYFELLVVWLQSPLFDTQGWFWLGHYFSKGLWSMIIVNSGDPERYVLRCSQAKRLQTPPSLSGCIYFHLLLVPCRRKEHRYCTVLWWLRGLQGLHPLFFCWYVSNWNTRLLSGPIESLSDFWMSFNEFRSISKEHPGVKAIKWAPKQLLDIVLDKPGALDSQANEDAISFTVLVGFASLIEIDLLWILVEFFRAKYYCREWYLLLIELTFFI